MLFGFLVPGCFETTVGVFSSPASIALCTAVGTHHPFSLALSAMIALCDTRAGCFFSYARHRRRTSRAEQTSQVFRFLGCSFGAAARENL
jgi:hypothetical protein